MVGEGLQSESALDGLGVRLAQPSFLSWLVATRVPHTVLIKLNISVLSFEKGIVHVTCL